MIWVVPMAGEGKRTRNLGKYKPFIPVQNRLIFEWMLLGVRPHLSSDDRFVLVTTRAFEQEFAVRETVTSLFQKNQIPCAFECVVVDQTPPGPAASVYAAKEQLQSDTSCIVINSDQFVNFAVRRDLKPHDAFLPLYVSSSPGASYVKIASGKITEIAEKQLISHYASAGVYGVGSARVLIDVIEHALKGAPHMNQEYYVGPALNHLLERGGSIYPMTTYAKYDLGNEDAIAAFSKSFSFLSPVVISS